MSLDTILHIGHTLNPKNREERQHSEWIRSFRFVSPPQEHEYTYWFSVEVDSEFIIDWKSLNEIEEKDRNNLCYFVNKTSNQDTSAPTYVFGDIFYVNTNGKESSNSFRITDKKESSIDRFKGSIRTILKQIIDNTKIEDKKCVKQIADFILKENSKIEPPKDVEPLLPIILFWRQVVREQPIIESLLKYAPIVYENKDSILDREKIESLYLKYVFENLSKFKQASKIIKECTRKENNNRKDKREYDEPYYSSLPESVKQSLLGCINHAVFLHFVFKSGEETNNWYEREDCCNIIYDSLISKITDKVSGGGIVLTKSIYPTICTGDDENDIQFPSFSQEDKYKSFSFKDKEHLFDLLYADGIIKHYRKAIKGTNIKILVYPRQIGCSMEESEEYAQSLENFIYNSKSEDSLFATDIFDCFNDDEAKKVIFDFIFVDTGGQTDVYLEEVSGLQKSRLKSIEERINNKSRHVSEQIGLRNYTVDTETAMTAILGIPDIKDSGEVFFSNKVKKGKKLVPYPVYQKHMLSIVPRIYQEQYFSDEILLPSTIRQIEYCVRNHKSSVIGDRYFSQLSQCYNKLKYSIVFMLDIQNNQISKYMEITNSKSYKVGLKLGELAKPLGREINSFQKNYVGMLTRRASSKEDCITLTNDIIEKLVLHDCTYQTTICGKVLEEIASLQEYDRESFAFGFFEGYFKYVANDSVEKFVEKVEKLLSDFSNKEELQDTLSAMKEAIDKLKNK